MRRKKPFYVTGSLLLMFSLALLLAACGDAASLANGTGQAPTALEAAAPPLPGVVGSTLAQQVNPTTIVVLPDGAECRRTSPASTLEFNGIPMNYTCTLLAGGELVLLGDPAPGTGDRWTAVTGSIRRDENGYSLDSTQTVSATVVAIEVITEAATQSATQSAIAVENGILCTRVDAQNNLLFDDKRLNYSCDDSAGNTVISGLIGDFQLDENGWGVEKAAIVQGSSGLLLESSQWVGVRPLQLHLDSGLICDFAGEGAALAFGGEPAHYTCTDPALAVIGILGEITPADETTWQASRIMVTTGAEGLEIASGDFITFSVQQIELADGLICSVTALEPPPTVEERPLTYICGQTEEGSTIGLLGGLLSAGDGAWSVQRVTIISGEDGPIIEQSDTVPVMRMNALVVEPDPDP
jgi:hypothetical protein